MKVFNDIMAIFLAAFAAMFLTAAASVSVAAEDAAPVTDPGSPSGMVWKSPVFTGEGTEYYPLEVMRVDGKVFELESFEIRHVEIEGDLIPADATVEFLLEGRETPPVTAVITLMDDATGNEYEREVPLMRTVEKDAFWSDDFSFGITVTDYDADRYMLDGTFISAGEDLKDYGGELIESLSLPGDCYRVNDVVWEGPPYEYEGIISRDAVAVGEKLVRLVEATYGGEVMTPAVKGKQYVSYYTEVIPEETEEEIIPAPETESETIPETEEILTGESEPDPPGIFEQIVQWVKEHLTAMTLSAGFLIILAFGMFLLFKSRR